MHVLIAAADGALRAELADLVSAWGFVPIAVATGADAWERLRDVAGPRLALFASDLEEPDALELSRRVRRGTVERYVHVCVLAQSQDEQVTIAAGEAGADDCLSLPVDAAALGLRLRSARRLAQIQEELVRTREELRREATHDSLTGLWNRAAVLSILDREVTRARREGTPVAVLIADVDHFKDVNDTYGHLTGDQVLREIASRLRGAVRPYDAVGRYGGEEFVFVLPGCDRTQALMAAERLRECVAVRPVELPAASVPVSISLGVTSTDAGGRADVERLITSADDALYRAKHEGRNRIVSDGAPTP